MFFGLQGEEEAPIEIFTRRRAPGSLTCLTQNLYHSLRLALGLKQIG